MAPITKNPDPPTPELQQRPAAPPMGPGSPKLPPQKPYDPRTAKPPMPGQYAPPGDDRDRERREREREQNERQRERGHEQDERQKDRDRDQKERQRGGELKPREDKQPRPEPGYNEGENTEGVQYTPNIAPEVPKEKRWQRYAVQAMNGLYPRLRDGVDYAVGRRTWDGDIELLGQGEGVQIDWGKVEEAAKKLVGADPYDDYKPRPGLSSSTKVEDPGEVPPRQGDERRPSLPPDIGVSQANPQLEGNRDKHLSQPYVEGQVAEDQREEEEEHQAREP